MSKTKRKNDNYCPRYYWFIYIMLACMLIFNLKFPLRILRSGTVGSVIFYAVISYKCFRIARTVSSRKYSRSLTVLVLLCAILSGWQVFDLTIMRQISLHSAASGSIKIGGTPPEYENVEDYVRWHWYSPNFPNEDILCHSIYEETIGNEFIALVIKVEHRPWFACGG